MYYVLENYHIWWLSKLQAELNEKFHLLLSTFHPYMKAM